MSLSKSSHERPKPLFKLILKGYVPPSQNSLRGCHWSVLHREKLRAGLALRSALTSIPDDPSIGITPSLSKFKTYLSYLESFLMTHTTFSKAASSLTRHTTRRKNAPK